MWSTLYIGFDRPVVEVPRQRFRGRRKLKVMQNCQTGNVAKANVSTNLVETLSLVRFLVQHFTSHERTFERLPRLVFSIYTYFHLLDRFCDIVLFLRKDAHDYDCGMRY
uniref:Uncharacterized protein n=1 Tax=Rhipicephalus zambeziensis TaxID=60191 RepID=A0A224Y5X7_9ACAR